MRMSRRRALGLSAAALTLPLLPRAQDAGLVLIEQGWGISQLGELGWAIIVDNPDPDRAVTNAAVRVTVYDPDGGAAATDTTHIATVLPGARTGFAGWLLGLADKRPALLDVELLPGAFRTLAALPALTVENVQFNGDRLQPTITATVRNDGDRPIANASFHAVARGEDGGINGSGFNFLSDLAPGRNVGLRVALKGTGAFPLIDVYPMIDNLTGYTV